MSEDVKKAPEGLDGLDKYHKLLLLDVIQIRQKRLAKAMLDCEERQELLIALAKRRCSLESSLRKQQ